MPFIKMIRSVAWLCETCGKVAAEIKESCCSPFREQYPENESGQFLVWLQGSYAHPILIKADTTWDAKVKGVGIFKDFVSRGNVHMWNVESLEVEPWDQEKK